MGMVATPGKIIAVHLNYRSRAAERGRIPRHPSYFLKPSSSATGTGTLERPAGTELLSFEGEIAVIIGRTARHLDPEAGWAAVSGVTAADDLGLYDLRAADRGSNVRSKGGDGFTPLGPAVIPAAGLDPDAIRVRTWLNGALVQEETSADLLFGFGLLVADLSEHLTLEPGDVILTGTPAGASVAVPGDVVEVEVDAPTAPGAPTTGRLVTRISDGTRPLGRYGAGPEVDDALRIDAWGSRSSAGLPEPARLDNATRSALASVSTATLSSQLRRRGIDTASVDGVVPGRPGQRMVGTARTLRFLPAREDLTPAHGTGYTAQKRAFDTVGAGEVLVIDARGERGTGTVGDILALRAAVRGAAGIVTDGGVRDSEAVAALGIPVWSAGPHPAVLGRRHVPWDTDVAIACGGTTVIPGDVIVGDSDGVLVIPLAIAHEVAEDAVEQERRERFIAEQVAAGASVDGLYPMDATWSERYDAWTGR